jgi:hypothetical protein
MRQSAAKPMKIGTFNDYPKDAVKFGYRSRAKWWVRSP